MIGLGDDCERAPYLLRTGAATLLNLQQPLLIAALFLAQFLDAVSPRRGCLNLPLQADDFPLDGRQLFHRRPDLRGEVPQDGPLEPDRPNAPRNPHPRALRLPKEVRMLFRFQTARNRVQFLPQLLEFSEMPRGFVGHGDQFLAAFFRGLLHHERVC